MLNSDVRESLVEKVNNVLRLFGIAVSREIMQQWEEKKFVPLWPTRNPDIFVAEASAAAYLIERNGWKDYQVQMARFHMAGCLEAKDGAVLKLDSFFSGVGIEGREEQYVDAMNWFFTVLKLLHGLPPNGGVAVMEVAVPGVGVAYATETAREDSIDNGKGSLHPREFKPPTGSYAR